MFPFTAVNKEHILLLQEVNGKQETSGAKSLQRSKKSSQKQTTY
jgi:hypothetical protein